MLWNPSPPPPPPPPPPFIRPPTGRPPSLRTSTRQDSTLLWENLPAAVMDSALKAHHCIIRQTLLLYRGYESATEVRQDDCPYDMYGIFALLQRLKSLTFVPMSRLEIAKGRRAAVASRSLNSTLPFYPFGSGAHCNNYYYYFRALPAGCAPHPQGDSFILAFHTAMDAVNFCVQVQQVGGCWARGWSVGWIGGILSGSTER
jgi:hypothetical protein